MTQTATIPAVQFGTEFVSFRELGEVTVLKEWVGRRGKKCSECEETVHKNQQTVHLNGGRIAHLACAGVEKKLPSCPNCFMIKDDCICDC